MGRQGMATAPLDGTRILLECVGCRGGTYVVEGSFRVGLGVKPRWQEWCGKDEVTNTGRLDPVGWWPRTALEGANG